MMLNKPAHKIFILIIYTQKLLLNPHADVSGVTRSLNFGPSFHLHPWRAQ